MAISCAAVENDTHPLKDMPNSFFAVDNSSSDLIWSDRRASNLDQPDPEELLNAAKAFN